MYYIERYDENGGGWKRELKAISTKGNALAAAKHRRGVDERWRIRHVETDAVIELPSLADRLWVYEIANRRRQWSVVEWNEDWQDWERPWLWVQTLEDGIRSLAAALRDAAEREADGDGDLPRMMLYNHWTKEV